MNFQQSIETCLRHKYARFSGRARRSEFWWFVLFIWVANLILSVIDGLLFGGLSMGAEGGSAWFISNGGPLSFVFSLAMIIPSLAVAVRRLHDIDRTGWWVLIGLIPLIGAVVLIVFCASRTRSGENRFGPEPAQD
ncbi:DUF805 domain-containing protein [Rhodobacteraceae bacterium]|nr:DUF805 domain-containing protein [Paracoccaceae bacterium]